MAAGPHSVGLETARDANLLRLFEDLALGLIALTAGGEFRLTVIRRRLRPLLAITAAHTIGILLLVAVETTPITCTYWYSLVNILANALRIP